MGCLSEILFFEHAASRVKNSPHHRFASHRLRTLSLGTLRRLPAMKAGRRRGPVFLMVCGTNTIKVLDL
jgi:hypothetical protein